MYAGYWTAMPLQYVAGDRLAVASGAASRFPAAQAAVAAAPAPGVYVGSDHDGTGEGIRAALTRAGSPSVQGPESAS